MVAACTSAPRPAASIDISASRDLHGPARLVLTEQWREHGRIVIVDETGDRLAPLLVPGRDADGKPALDEHPAFSPDGEWIVFASTRDHRSRYNLWVARAAPDAVPRRITESEGSDIDPIWVDGAIVFARSVGRSFDLYRLPMTGGAPSGDLQQLTDTPEHEMSPSVAAGRLVFQQVDPIRRRGWIAERDADGTLRPLTDGPADGQPALSPDGRKLAYATKRLHEDDLDLDVVVLDGEGFEVPGLGFGLSGSSEGSPTWSHDGRWLFVTSILRGPEPTDTPLLSSVIHRDTWEPGTSVRMLRDTAGAAPRLGIALGPVRLDETALRRNLDHVTAVGYALQELAERASAAQAREKR